MSGENKYPDLLDDSLFIEATLGTLIDAAVFEQPLPEVKRDETQLEDELEAAIELGMFRDHFACFAT
jgi:hypothetical protein